MRRLFNWQVSAALILVTCSILVYLLHYFIFRDARHIFLYLIGDIAFLFLDVLIVMLVLHRILTFREKQSLLRKLNMVIGAFFCEVGTELLSKFTQFDREQSEITKRLLIAKDWSDKQFISARKSVQQYSGSVNSKKGDLAEVKNLLLNKRQFLLGLLENPNLLEHESFTDLLWAVFHVTDELAHRPNLSQLPDSDYEHLSGDIKRAYQKLIIQWLDYMMHLKHDYPYLFSLALRTNPFDKEASVVVR
jgi:hypothetical protein